MYVRFDVKLRKQKPVWDFSVQETSKKSNGFGLLFEGSKNLFSLSKLCFWCHNKAISLTACAIAPSQKS